MRAALRQAQGILLREDSFDPASVERAFTIALPGSVEAQVMPRLLALLRCEAPGVRLPLRMLDDATVLDELDADSWTSPSASSRRARASDAYLAA